jgi:hypothetical protein
MALKFTKRRLLIFSLIEAGAILIALVAALFVASPSADFKGYSETVAFMFGVITILNGVVTTVLSREEDKEDRETERLRGVYTELSKVSYGYYGALAMLQTGEWNLDIITGAEMEMNKTGGLTMDLSKTQKQIWLDFHQTGLNIADTVTTSKHDKESRIAFWSSAVGSFADKLERVKKIAEFR